MPCRRRGADACGSAAALRREIPGQPHPDYRIAPPRLTTTLRATNPLPIN